MKLITLPFASGAELLSSYRDDAHGGALWCETRAELTAGEIVLVELSFPALPNRALVRCEVAGPEPGRGAWLQFAGEDVTTRDFVLGVARGTIQVTTAAERHFERFPAALPVDCQLDRGAERILSQTEDVGAGGVFVRCVAPPPIGTRVVLSIGPAADGAFGHITLTGEVVWVRNDVQSRGFAVRFDGVGEMDARRWRVALRHASETGRITFAAPTRA
jgi:Tfp pilus assembly protein PilZ